MDKKTEIIKFYLQGSTYKEISLKFKVTNNFIADCVRGIRTPKEAALLCSKRGRRKLSDSGRLVLSECGKLAAKRTGKFWTKPEREFKSLLNSLEIAVKFPDYVKEICKTSDDVDARNGFVFYQYPIQRYVCDYVDECNKIVFRINGDFWHANPILYDKLNLTKIQQHNLKQDINCKIFLEKQGWEVVDIWESEIYWNPEIVKNKIQAVRKMVNPPPLHGGNTGIDTQTAYLDWSEELKKLWFKQPKITKPKIQKKCVVCNSSFEVIKSKENRSKCCCKECRFIYSRKVDRPTKETLLEHIENMSWVAIGRKYGVSDKTVIKWATTYGIKK